MFSLLFLFSSISARQTTQAIGLRRKR